METESFVSLPLDLTIEILLRLPAKSIGRFRCVSKLWSTMTTTPSFVKSYSVHSSARPCLLYCKNGEEKCVFYSLPHHHDTEKYLPKEETGLPLRIITNENNIHHQSIHGLIPVENSESVIIWNPTLKQHVTLPQLKVSKPFISLLGYDPIGDEYKVLCMSLWVKDEDPQIFTLGPGESWRRLIIQDISPSHVKFYKAIWRCINGVVYYLAADNTIVSFDVRSEKFGVIQIPDMSLRMKGLPWGIKILPCGFIRHRGRLALFSYISSLRGRISLWILEDAEKHEWVRKDSSLPFKTLTSLSTGEGIFLLRVSGETVDDELIYLPDLAERPFYAIFYDLERNRVRKVEYEGIGEIKFIRSHCFPNHIESLMSLNDLLTAA
ncbi:unnamed protein product [Eruca vesicaria subsp. sativa]|uniref:F-box domain-containing protein n=1 Tax=Eruca vesicaria subsp. sativa TaxID=29727 RepID=A0ABC8M5J4_ERUVS|nr:unnamed protein product [Eruca vesicaria subsp. sativa]